MTPKAIRDAVVELRDMAYELERRAVHIDAALHNRRGFLDRAAMLRDVAHELERVEAVSADALGL